MERDDLVGDGALLARLPAGLAAYYLALPLACEDGMISVAMAHPENETALAVLSAVLGGPIVPVRVRSEALQATIRRYYHGALPSQSQILCWSAGSGEAASIAETATTFATAIDGSVRVLSATELTLETVLTIAAKGQYRLTVLSLPSDAPLAPFLHQATASLLLFRGAIPGVHRALVALRGYAADCHVLDWLAPLLQQPAAVTLLPLPHMPQEDAGLTISTNGSGKNHLERCLRHRALAGARILVRFRQGQAARQVVDELRQEPYDLLAISAEGYGRFVGDVLTAVEAEPTAANTALFLLSPPAMGREDAARTTFER